MNLEDAHNFPAGGQFHVGRVEAQTHAILLALDGAVREADGHIVRRTGLVAQQSMREAELADQLHGLLQLIRFRHLQRRRRGVKQMRGGELLFVGSQRVFGNLGDG